MVVFLNMLLLKYNHAHNIHHCPFYPFSNIGLGFCYSILKGKLLLFFNIFGRKLEERKYFGYTQLCFIEYLRTVWFLLRLYKCTNKNFDRVRMVAYKTDEREMFTI